METIKLIPLSQGKFAKVDASLFDVVNKHKWYYRSNDGYAAKNVTISGEIYDNGKQKHVKQRVEVMHRFILDFIGTLLYNNRKMVVDHIDGDKLNNTIANLRIIPMGLNNHNRHNRRIRNKTGYSGVSEVKYGVKKEVRYRATLGYGGKVKTLGYYLSAIDASNAVEEARKKLFE